MGRGFKLTLRTALVLLIFTGMALIAYASVVGSPRRAPARMSSAVRKIVSRVRPRPEPPRAVAPVPRPSSPAQQPAAGSGRPPARASAAPQPTRAAQPPAPAARRPAQAAPSPTAVARPQAPIPAAPAAPQPGATTAPAPTSPAASPAAPAQPAQRRTELVNFSTVLRDNEKNREEATVVGDRAVLRERIYDVINPLVVVLLWPSEGQPVDIELPKVHLKADRAEVDEVRGVVRFFGNVAAKGEDFEVTTDSVVYAVNERSLTSDKPVRMQRDKADKAGNWMPALVVTGEGLEAELAARNMSVLRDTNAHLYDVSDDFLAAGLDGRSSTGVSQEVVITSDGPLLYEHMTRKVTFSDNVAAVTGEKKLTCQKLTIQLARSEATKRLEVSEVVATGKARLAYQDQVALGDKLEWDNVTQTGVLTGSPAVLATPQFELTGKELTLYRVNDRFHSEGPGSLLWKGGGKAAAQRGIPEGGWNVGPLRTSSDEPILVTWTESMTYHAAAHVATFKGQVVARQGESSLQTDQLALSFEPTSGAIQRVEADRDVAVRDQRGAAGPNLSSDRLVWDAARDTVELVAREGETVSVESGGHSVVSRHLVVDNPGQTVASPAPGWMIVKPPAQKAAGAGQPEPIQVNWHENMLLEQGSAPAARFSGAVTARRGDQQIAGEAMHAEFDKKMNPMKITATGDAVIEVRPSAKTPAEGAGATSGPGGAAALLPAVSGGRWRIASRQFDISVPDDVVTSAFPGVLTIFRGDATAGTITWQKGMRLDTAKNAAVFEGDVNAEFSGAILKSGKLTLEFDDARKLRHVFAEGSVFFSRQEQGAWQVQSRSAEAVFATENELQQVIARDDVQVRDEKRLLTAKLLQLFFRRGAAGAEPSLDRAVAQDTVRVKYIQDERLEAGGDRLEWGRNADLYVLTGSPDAYLRRGALKVLNSKILVDRLTGKMTLPPGARPVRTMMGPEEE